MQQHGNFAGPPRIALVVVHGVGNQAPGETAKAAADLLLTFPQQTAQYVGFDTTCEIDIPVRRVQVRDGPEEKKGWRFFDERPPAVVRMHGSTAASKEAAHHFDHAYMKDVLREAEITGTDCTYQTVRIHGWRPATAERPASAIDTSIPARGAREVHIFEMYWADLSRLVPGVFTFLSELYLLLFFVCQLGRKSIDSALAAHGHQRGWSGFRICQAFAERAFTRFISVLNLYLLALVVVLVPLHLPTMYHGAIALVVTAILVVAGSYWIAQNRIGARHWPLAFVFAAVLAVAAALALFVVLGAWSTSFAVLISWTAAVVVVGRVMYAFSERQPGVFGVTIAAGVAITVYFGATLIARRDEANGYVDAALWTAEYIWLALAICWTVFGFLTFATGVMGLATWAFALREDKGRTWRVVWTVATSLTVPPTLFLILTLALWEAMLHAGDEWLPTHVHRPIWFFRWYLGVSEENAKILIQSLVIDAAPPIFYVGFGLFALLIAFAAWSLLPAALSEDTRKINTEVSKWLGNCLSAGYSGLVVALAVIGIMFWVGSPLVAVYCYIFPGRNDPLSFLQPYGTAVLNVLALAILAIVSSQGRLHFLAGGLNVVLDVVLDVANWLRYLPPNRNPKNRICARYVSLLRYLCAWKDPHDGRGYDALVIMAHSQGCIITMDLLRFLKAEDNDGALKKLTQRELPLYFFTMGNPLRQLYSWPLPYIYDWGRHDNTDMAAPPNDLAATSSQPSPKPDPSELLGVQLWVNAYRSGDYVGRHVWRTDDCMYLYDPFPNHPVEGRVSRDGEPGLRQEFCIGNGGHTHYWDDTAPDIARKLDELIAKLQTPADPAANAASGGSTCQADAKA